jgi:hypothetical protein
MDVARWISALIALAAMVMAIGGFAFQARQTAKITEQLASRMVGVEKQASDTASVLGAATRTIERVVSRLEVHEREGATLAERVTHHGQEIDRLRNERCT